MGITMQALTSNSSTWIVECVHRLLVLANAKNIESSINIMHKLAGIEYNTIKYTTRCWFAWANSLFSELVIKMLNGEEEYFEEAFTKLTKT